MAARQSTRFTPLDLKIARIKVGLKQYELAARVGIGPTKLCEIEAGRREVSPELLKRILGAIKSNKQAEEQT
ncbi:MAG: helix-turn-helix transcriptional regulator [Desulfobacteraceae bacterium]|nr:helix-turn-helix transcriptional regulator [Desulfobacteraceae bacterium]